MVAQTIASPGRTLIPSRGHPRRPLAAHLDWPVLPRDANAASTASARQRVGVDLRW